MRANIPRSMINMPDERTNAEEPVSTGRELLGDVLVVTGEDEATWPEQLVIQDTSETSNDCPENW